MFFQFGLAALLASASASDPPRGWFPAKIDKNFACERVFDVANKRAIQRVSSFEEHVAIPDPTQKALSVYTSYIGRFSERLAITSQKSNRSVPFFDGVIFDAHSNPVANLKIEKVSRPLNMTSTTQLAIEKFKYIGHPETWLNLNRYFRFSTESIDMRNESNLQLFGELIDWAASTMDFYGIWSRRPTRILVEYEGGPIEKYLSPLKVAVLMFSIGQQKFDAVTEGPPIVDSITFINGYNLFVITQKSAEKITLTGY